MKKLILIVDDEKAARFGMKMEINPLKELTRMGKKMDYGLNGGRMDRRKVKELTFLET